MNRNPVYSKDNNQYRIAAFPGGMWQLQKHDGTKGVKAGLAIVDNKAQAVPHNDPWKPIRRAVEWSVAKVQLVTLVPKPLPSAS